jgi:hypothetical protein
LEPRHSGPFGSASINPLPHEIEGAAPEPARPFSVAELRGALFGPHRVARLVLTERARLAASVAEQEHLGLLVAVLLMASLVLALPFGAVLGLDGFWRVSWLLLGSLLVCFPSLHVFGAYLGSRASVAQSLCLALALTCVAGLFCFAFFPIVWFLDATMTDAGQVTAAGVAVVLLGVALLFGIMHLTRILFAEPSLRSLGVLPKLIFLFWQLLFLLIAYRMAGFLELI